MLRPPACFSLFETPAFVFHVDQTAPLTQLGEILTLEAATTPSVKRSNYGGWHSVPDLAKRTALPFAALHDLVIHYVGFAMNALAESMSISALPKYGYSVHSWAMVMGNGDYTTLHDHTHAHWSAVYYADAGDADLATYPDSGQLSFVDPRRSVNFLPGLDMFPSVFNLTPATGMLVIVPGWLQHYVHAYRGTRQRVSIASNINLVLPDI